MTAKDEHYAIRFTWLLAIVATAAVVALNVFLLAHAGGFCGDEVQVLNLAATHSLPAMTHDSFPVLLPVLVSGWVAIVPGGSDIDIRLLGMLIAVGMTGALWLVTLRARRTPPLLGVILFGLNGFAIYWGNYLRAYGLGTLLILLTMAAMVSFLAEPTKRRAALLAIAAILSVQALFHNAAFFAAICFGGWMICILRKDKLTALKILVIAMMAAASLLPYWNCITRWQTGTAAVRPGFSIAAITDNLHTVLSFPLPQYSWLWGLLTLAVITAGTVALCRRRTVQSSGHLTTDELCVFAAATLVASVAGYFAFLKFAAMITSPWYFLPLMAVMAACFDIAISLTPFPRTVRVIAMAILLASAVIAIPFAARDLNCRFTNADLIARRLTSEASPGDYIVVTPWHLGISFNRYYHGAAAWDTLPPLSDHSTYRFDLLKTLTDTKAPDQPVLDKISDTLRSGHRVWIVGWMSAPRPGQRAYSEVSQFIADHSQSFEPLPLNFHGAVSDYENESLLAADGWKTNRP